MNMFTAFAMVTDRIGHQHIVNVNMIVDIERFADNDHRVKTVRGGQDETILLNNEEMGKLYKALSDASQAHPINVNVHDADHGGTASMFK